MSRYLKQSDVAKNLDEINHIVYLNECQRLNMSSYSVIHFEKMDSKYKFSKKIHPETKEESLNIDDITDLPEEYLSKLATETKMKNDKWF